MKKLVLALLLILLQLCTACSETTYHSNEEIGRAFQRHKSTFENVAVSAVGENSGYIHKPDAPLAGDSCAQRTASLLPEKPEGVSRQLSLCSDLLYGPFCAPWGLLP